MARLATKSDEDETAGLRHRTARVSKPGRSLGPSDVMKMIALPPLYSAPNPDHQGGDTGLTTLRSWVIFDGADAQRIRPSSEP
jgi:hypothetical protein